MREGCRASPDPQHQIPSSPASSRPIVPSPDHTTAPQLRDKLAVNKNQPEPPFGVLLLASLHKPGESGGPISHLVLPMPSSKPKQIPEARGRTHSQSKAAIPSWPPAASPPLTFLPGDRHGGHVEIPHSGCVGMHFRAQNINRFCKQQARPCPNRDESQLRAMGCAASPPALAEEGQMQKESLG